MDGTSGMHRVRGANPYAAPTGKSSTYQANNRLNTTYSESKTNVPILAESGVIVFALLSLLSSLFGFIAEKSDSLSFLSVPLYGLAEVLWSVAVYMSIYSCFDSMLSSKR